MPPAEPRTPVLVWRRGDAVLAARVESVLEIVTLPANGPAPTREGEAPVLNLPGLPRDRTPRAVVVRCGTGLAALPADAVDGVRAVATDGFADPPAWLATLAPDHVRGILTLDDDRLAALLDLDALRPPS